MPDGGTGKQEDRKKGLLASKLKSFGISWENTMMTECSRCCLFLFSFFLTPTLLFTVSNQSARVELLRKSAEMHFASSEESSSLLPLSCKSHLPSTVDWIIGRLSSGQMFKFYTAALFMPSLLKITSISSRNEHHYAY